MGNEQLKLFKPEPTPLDIDIDALAAHIAANAPDDPYSEQERRQHEIDARKTGTYAPEDVPDHLRGTMDLAEQHFRKTAPGSVAVEGARPEIPEAARQAIDKARKQHTATRSNSARGATPRYWQSRIDVLGGGK